MIIFSPLNIAWIGWICQAGAENTDELQEGLSLPRTDAKMIRKCCPYDLYLDDWYDCTEKLTGNTRKEFRHELLQVGLDDYEVVRHADEWRKCLVRDRREYEVINIPEKSDDKVYVFTDILINYDSDEDEVNFNGVLELQGVPRELTKSIGLLHRPGSFPGPFIMWKKFTDQFH
jgi:hypothetical protein